MQARMLALREGFLQDLASMGIRLATMGVFPYPWLPYLAPCGVRVGWNRYSLVMVSIWELGHLRLTPIDSIASLRENRGLLLIVAIWPAVQTCCHTGFLGLGVSRVPAVMML